MVNEDYIDVKLDIFEYMGQRAQVRKSLTVGTLKDEILREFDDIPADFLDDYAVYLKGVEDPLNENKTLTELDIQPQDELVFNHLRSFIRKMLPADQVVYFVEETIGKVFKIQWQPAIIGRPSTDIDHNIVLAVNLEPLPDSNYVSRRHAEFIREDGKYFIKPLAEYNPVYLNGKKLFFGRRYEIRNEDKLTLGPRKITLFFKTEIKANEADSESSPQPAPASLGKVEVPQQTFIGDVEEAIQNVEKPNLMIISAMNQANLGNFIVMDTFPYLLGRSNPLLNENFVSRKHAQISRDEKAGKYYVSDLGSTNGVTVDGKTITANALIEIVDGSRIGLGKNLVLRLNI